MIILAESQVPTWLAVCQAITPIAVFLLALYTAVRALSQYRQKVAIDEFTTYAKFVEWVNLNTSYAAISKAVRSGDTDKALAAVDVSDRRAFLALLESLALLINSKLVREEVAYYTFATTVLGAADRPDLLWGGVIPVRDSKRWALIHDLVKRFQRLDKTIVYDRHNAQFGPRLPVWSREQ